MTLQSFITTWLGKQVEYHSYDPRAKYQCVDLANDYITKVWGLEAIIGTDAKDFPERLKPGMEFVKNTTDYLPEAGELAVWDGKVGGGAGHISVTTEKGKQATFKSLDQNWSKPLFVTQETHNYNNVRGFIRKKGSMNMYKGYDLANPESMKVAVDVLVRLQSGELMEKSEHQKQLETLIKEKDVAVGDAYARGLGQLQLCEADYDKLAVENAQLKKKLAEKQPTVDMDKWELNGLNVVEGNKTYNYKLKA